jgi:hypothetical protein
MNDAQEVGADGPTLSFLQLIWFLLFQIVIKCAVYWAFLILLDAFGNNCPMGIVKICHRKPFMQQSLLDVPQRIFTIQLSSETGCGRMQCWSAARLLLRTRIFQIPLSEIPSLRNCLIFSKLPTNSRNPNYSLCTIWSSIILAFHTHSVEWFLEMDFMIQNHLGHLLQTARPGRELEHEVNIRSQIVLHWSLGSLIRIND